MLSCAMAVNGRSTTSKHRETATPWSIRQMLVDSLKE
jgi:hypothetical protein